MCMPKSVSPITEAVTLYYPAKDGMPEDRFYFASADGELFYEVTRLPKAGDALPVLDGPTRPMAYVRRYFRQRPDGVEATFHRVA